MAAEIWFYHLGSQPLERALPSLVEKAVSRGWRVVVQTVDDGRVKALDELLWTFAADSFLPHGISGERGAERQPVLLTRDAGNENGAVARLYVDGAAVELDPSDAGYQRVMVLFDGRDEDAVAAARLQWSRLKGRGFALAYWQQSDDGRWERRT